MRIAAIIVNYNDSDCTIRYVQKIKEYKIIDRIVVVDNMSTTAGAFERLKRLRDEKVKVIQSYKNGGYNYGNNFGVTYLQNNGEKYDYYIISNPDIDVSEEAIRKCIDELEKDENVAVAAPRMFNKDNKPIRRSAWKRRTFGLDVIHSTRLLELLFYRILRRGEYSSKEFEQDVLEVEAISGAFFIIKSKVLNEIGLFNENVFLFYEEDILAKDLSEINLKTISVNTEKFIHYESQTIGKTFSYFNKMNYLFESKMYYQEEINKINMFQVIIFYILYMFRNIELLIEIPVRKILHK